MTERPSDGLQIGKPVQFWHKINLMVFSLYKERRHICIRTVVKIVLQCLAKSMPVAGPEELRLMTKETDYFLKSSYWSAQCPQWASPVPPARFSSCFRCCKAPLRLSSTSLARHLVAVPKNTSLHPSLTTFFFPFSSSSSPSALGLSVAAIALQNLELDHLTFISIDLTEPLSPCLRPSS